MLTTSAPTAGVALETGVGLAVAVVVPPLVDGTVAAGVWGEVCAVGAGRNGVVCDCSGPSVEEQATSINVNVVAATNMSRPIGRLTSVNFLLNKFEASLLWSLPERLPF